MMYRLAAAYTVSTMALRDAASARLQHAAVSDPEDGSTAAEVVTIAAFVLIAIGVVTIIGNAVMAKAHSISFDTPNLTTNP